MTEPVALPELPHARVPGLHARGLSVSQIVKETGLSTLDVQAALDNAAHGRLMSGTGHQARRASDARRKPVPLSSTPGSATLTTTGTATAPTTRPITGTATAAAAAAVSGFGEPGSVGELLAWGERHDNLRVRAEARRAREALAELRRRRAAEAEARRSAIEVEVRTAELASAKAAARAAGDAVAKPTTQGQPNA
jgi:hypothetical protein